MSIFALAMEHFGNEENIDIDASILRGPVLGLVSKAIDDQEDIGWKAMFQGFLALRWSEAQEMSYRTNGTLTRTRTGRLWGRAAVTILQEYTYNCWKSRNEVKHGKEKEETRNEELKRLKKKIRELYKYKKKLRKESGKKHFYMPVNKRTKQGLQSMKIWISTAEEIIRQHREEATKNTIDHWLKHRSG